MSDFEAEREATIARNRALLAELDVSLDVPKPKKSSKAPPKPKAAAKKRKRSLSPAPTAPSRSSRRLRRTAVPANETPEQKRLREQEEEALRKKLEEERLAEEERAREARKPRHDPLEMYTLLDDTEASSVMGLTAALQVALQTSQPRRVGAQDVDHEDSKAKREVAELKKKLAPLKIVSRAKVTKERVYTAAYHPEVTKDLIFFGDKHGALEIWDAQAPADSPEDDDDDDTSTSAKEQEGKYWRMQLHWPASSASSISAVKFNPTDSHSVLTSSYDCTLRSTSFVTGISTEVFHNEGVHIQSFDVTPTGHELWVSDMNGGVTHLDQRENKSKSRWYQLSGHKIGCVSINPVDPVFLLTASNSRMLRVWDVRKLHDLNKGRATPIEISFDEIEERRQEDDNKSMLRGEWAHGLSASSAYWDPHGRRIVSTSYDNILKFWNFKPSVMHRNAPFPSMRPTHTTGHDCQTGRWVTMFKAQWCQNPDVYPYVTIGDMKQSLNIYACNGETIAKLADSSITAVQAVTCTHPSIVERVASGNASGRCILWGPADKD